MVYYSRILGYIGVYSILFSLLPIIFNVMSMKKFFTYPVIYIYSRFLFQSVESNFIPFVPIMPRELADIINVALPRLSQISQQVGGRPGRLREVFTLMPTSQWLDQTLSINLKTRLRLWNDFSSNDFLQLLLEMTRKKKWNYCFTQ